MNSAENLGHRKAFGGIGHLRVYVILFQTRVSGCLSSAKAGCASPSPLKRGTSQRRKGS